MIRFKRLHYSALITLLFLLGCVQPPAPRPPFKEAASRKITTIKGQVKIWPTDTVYYATFTFHSPYATTEGFQVLTPGKTFEYNFDQVKEPFVIFLTPERKFLDLRNDVLFENLTDKYYRGYCDKFYDYPITTYLIEPGTETKVELSKTTRYGQTMINFLNENRDNTAYYQTTFVLDQRLDEVLDSRSREALKDLKNVDLAINNLENQVDDLLFELSEEQPYISPFLYKYTKAEIEFAARKEFLRYLLFDHREEALKLFKDKLSARIIKVVEFDKVNIDYATKISQEYNEFLELYITFKFSQRHNKLIKYKAFDKEKFEFALEELPAASKYDYLANNILHSKASEITNELANKLIKLYPTGNLNHKLRLK